MVCNVLLFPQEDNYVEIRDFSQPTHTGVRGDRASAHDSWFNGQKYKKKKTIYKP